MTTPPAILPDTKDWTWVLDRPCSDCGFDPAAVARAEIGAAIRANAAAWESVLPGPGDRDRPAPATWSPTEYACHVRDVHAVFAGRLDAMLVEHGPVFANWDQDEAAVTERYDLQDPAVVVPDLVAAANAVAARYDAVAADAWGRTGLRSNGSAFTVETLGRYHLHDLVHHWWDVRHVHRSGAGR